MATPCIHKPIDYIEPSQINNLNNISVTFNSEYLKNKLKEKKVYDEDA